MNAKTITSFSLHSAVRIQNTQAYNGKNLTNESSAAAFRQRVFLRNGFCEQNSTSFCLFLDFVILEIGCRFVCFKWESGGQLAGGVVLRCVVANCIRRFAVVQAGPGKR